MANAVIFEIKQYMVIWRQLENRELGGTTVKIRGVVRCSGHDPRTNEAYTMDVMFLAPDSPFPDPIFDEAGKKGYMFLPISDIAAFVDILRNEKPIFGHLRGDKPEWTSVTTTQEPVGEGEISQST
jgi:hypothetical protein